MLQPPPEHAQEVLALQDVDPLAPLTFHPHEARRLKDPQVTAGGGPGAGEAPGDLPRAHPPSAGQEHHQHVAPGGVGQGRKHLVQLAKLACPPAFARDHGLHLAVSLTNCQPLDHLESPRRGLTLAEVTDEEVP